MVKEFTQKRLKEFKPQKRFFIGVDSDGCVFDSMGIKHRECFCPWMIGYFGLQPVAQAARECKDFADLFSKTRGANRHKTLKLILTELLPSHPMTRERNFSVPRYPHYFAWVDDPNSTLSNDGLKKAIDSAESEEIREELVLVLEWSEKVNWAVKEIVKGIPPFRFVEESLRKARQKADIIVVSATPCEALEREWEEQNLRHYVCLIAGQEMGTKAEHIRLAAEGKYPPHHMLTVGDAPGDYQAAVKNGALFFPVNPGEEELSWERFSNEALEKFFDGTYAGDYERTLLREFESLLPETPPWKS